MLKNTANIDDGLTSSLFQSILLATDGTVTDLISLFTGEKIHITKLHQSTVTASTPEALALEQPSQLLKREILLSGPHKHYLYASSFFVISRMSPAMQHALLETDTPIGLLWKQARLETFREIISTSREPLGNLGDYFTDATTDDLLCRTYLIYHGGLPLGVITEKFPASYFSD